MICAGMLECTFWCMKEFAFKQAIKMNSQTTPWTIFGRALGDDKTEPEE